MTTIHGSLFSQIVDWAKQPIPRSPSSLFLYGPPGIGKTTLARAALEAADYRVVEWNASQHRHKAAVEESLIPLLNSRNVADFFRPEGPRNLGVILDEIDGMSVGDKGGLSELVRILKGYEGAFLIGLNSHFKGVHETSLQAQLINTPSPLSSKHDSTSTPSATIVCAK